MKIIFGGTIGRSGLGGQAWASLQYLIGLRGLGFQLIQCGIAEDFPPRSFWHIVQRRACFPGAEIL